MTIDQHQAQAELDAQRDRKKDRTTVTLLVVLIGLLVIAAISGGAYFLTRDTPTPEPTPSPTTAQRAADEAAAVELVQDHNTARDAALAANSMAGTGYEDLNSPSLVEDLQAVIDNNVRGGYTYTGTRAVEAEVTDWDPNVLLGPDARRITVDVCSDISGVSRTTADGTPVQNVNPDGTPDNLLRRPIVYYINASGDGSEATYVLDSTLPDADRTATC